MVLYSSVPYSEIRQCDLLIFSFSISSSPGGSRGFYRLLAFRALNLTERTFYDRNIAAFETARCDQTRRQQRVKFEPFGRIGRT